MLVVMMNEADSRRRVGTLPLAVLMLAFMFGGACLGGEAGGLRDAVTSAFVADTIENFDDGVVELFSYPGEDAHPDSWALDSVNTYADSPFSLRMFGNTWKLESISPIELDTGDVWQVAMFVASLGEIQGFGLVDSADTMYYPLAGSQQLHDEKWVTVYQGAFPQDTWNTYPLPVGEDWLALYGYLPTINRIIFINDRDTDPHAIAYFDEVIDITSDLPVPPQVEIWYTTGDVFENGDGTWSVTVQFHSTVTDPDSEHHGYYWHFGDDSTSSDSNPSHTYIVGDDHEYTVLLEVVDSTGQWGRASCRVTVDPGPTTFPVTMNFVGDIMLARRYESPGGIIDTLGVEGIFDPTLPYLGDAADITVANLECPLTTRGPRHPTKPIVFRGRPSNVAGLVHAGIDVVSLANNHVIDYGLEGLRETQEVLGAHGIRYSGAGANSYEAHLPLFYQKSGVNIAFLAFSDRTGQYDNLQPYLNAGYNKPGFAKQDTFRIFREIHRVEPDADLIVVELHAGEEYSPVPWDEEPAEDEFYSPFALFPSPVDMQVRRRAIEEGADLIVCHHPHMLQGFEVYNGKLIAHSLGDFTFDLNYPETYPTVILNAGIDETGFYEYSVTPVYIDDYIPLRAEGGLGLYMLDEIARRSGDLGTYVIVNRGSVTAEIVLDTTALTRWVLPYTDELQLREENGYWVSNPLRLPRDGCISSAVSATPSRDWQFRVGREAVWFGSFEDEGCTMWLLNHADEFYDTVACRGSRSLCQVRPEGNGLLTTNFEERLACYSDSSFHTLYGHVKTENAHDAGAVVRFYSSRYGATPLGSSDLGTEVTGTTDWAFYHKEFVPADGTRYIDVRLGSYGPQSGGQGRTWFDDVGIIEWEEWQPLDSPTNVPEPNDYYRVQIRTDVATATATLSYEETVYSPPVAARDRTGSRPGFRSFRSFPNPAGSNPIIRYDLTGTARVALRIYNVLGQEVRTLIDGLQVRGPKTITWDGRDNQGRILGSGAYFCRLRVGEREQSRKIVLSR